MDLWTLGLALAAQALTSASSAVAARAPLAWPGATVTFEFETERYLAAGQRGGGLVYVTDGVAAGASTPLVVFLHGLNVARALHPWFNGDPGDLRPIANGLVRRGSVAPFLLAAPTQSKNALVPKILWPEFDLDAFIDAVDVALDGRALASRREVLLVGHSGGACNPKGGVVGAPARAAAAPRAVLSVDSCLDAEIAAALRAAPPETRVRVYWQRATWPRRFDAFRALVEGPNRTCEEITGLKGMPHDAILPAVLERDLPKLLPPDPPQ